METLLPLLNQSRCGLFEQGDSSEVQWTAPMRWIRGVSVLWEKTWAALGVGGVLGAYAARLF
jgi:hypothetical protein